MKGIKLVVCLLVLLGFVRAGVAQQHMHRFLNFKEQPGEPQVYKDQKVASFSVSNVLIDSAEITKSPFVYEAHFRADGQKELDSANTSMGFSNRFEYDERGRLIKEIYNHRNRISYIEYSYQSNVLVSKEEEFDSNHKLKKTHLFEYASDGKMMAVYTFKSNDLEDTLAVNLFSYDKEDRLSKRIQTSTNNGYSFDSEYDYEYDKEGRLVQIELTMASSVETYAMYAYPSENTVVYTNFAQARSIKYEYNANGLLERKIYMNDQKTITGKSEYFYQKHD